MLLVFGGVTAGLSCLVVIGTITAELTLSRVGFFVGCVFVFPSKMRLKVHKY